MDLSDGFGPSSDESRDTVRLSDAENEIIEPSVANPGEGAGLLTAITQPFVESLDISARLSNQAGLSILLTPSSSSLECASSSVRDFISERMPPPPIRIEVPLSELKPPFRMDVPPHRIEVSLSGLKPPFRIDAPLSELKSLSQA